MENNNKEIKARIVPYFNFSFLDHPLREPSVVVYFCGCPHKCKGCHSPELQDASSPMCETISAEEFIGIFDILIENFKRFIKGLILLGGEPLLYSDFLSEVLPEIKQKYFDLSIVLYTGYQFNEIPQNIKQHIDFVVDGPFVEELKTNSFPASSNQKVYKKENSQWIDFTSSFLQH
jgi:anaerobic ribonucleoside-triphosphate reductase activating protein